MNKYRQHQNFEKEVILTLQEEFKGLRLIPTATGQAFAKFSVTNAMKHLLKTRDINAAMKKLIIIKYGTIGQPDLTGLYYGRWVGIEIKTGVAVQSKEQKAFEKMILERQGIYLKITNQEEILKQVAPLYEMKELVCK